MKRILCAAAAAALAISSLSVGAQSNRVTVHVNGEPITFNNILPRRAATGALIPLRPVIDRLGGQVRWEPENRTIWVSMQNDYFVRVYPGETFVQADGRNIPIDIAPRIVRGQTFVPAQFFQKALGIDTVENLSTGDVALQTRSPQGDNEVTALRSTTNRAQTWRRQDMDAYNRDRIMANENYQWHLQQQDYNLYLNERLAWEQAYQNYLSILQAQNRNLLFGYLPSAPPYLTYLYGWDFHRYLVNRAAWQANYQAYLNMLAQNNGVFPNQTLINQADWQNYLKARENLIQQLQNNPPAQNAPPR